MGNQIEIPKEWHPVDDYSSHKPALYLALINSEGLVHELGSGLGSTPFLRKYCEDAGREFNSFDTNKEWAEKTGATPVEDWSGNAWRKGCGLCFVDMAPGEFRREALGIMKRRASIIVIHDTEDYAQRVYEIVDALKSFRYRLDLHIPAHPSTTILSDYVDVGAWKGKYGEFEFV